MDGTVIAFPLPMLTFLLAVVAAVFVARIDTGVRHTNLLLLGFFMLIAVGSFLVGLRFGYGVVACIPVQRVIPLFAGPFLYLAFLGLAVAGPRYKMWLTLHLGVACGLAAGSILTGAHMDYLDAVIGLSYLFYAAALLALWAKGTNHLSRARIALATPLWWFVLAGAGMLIVFLIADTAIAISFAFARRESALALLSAGAVVMIVVLLTLIFVISAGRSRGAAPVMRRPDDTELDPLEARARALLSDSQLYLDTDLTVDRLAKWLHVPSRSLSIAINQCCGMNVSQYVKDFRLDHAASLLDQGQASVAEVMEQSGFLTRSNFYRTFQSRFGMSPAVYRDRAKTTSADT